MKKKNLPEDEIQENVIIFQQLNSFSFINFNFVNFFIQFNTEIENLRWSQESNAQSESVSNESSEKENRTSQEQSQLTDSEEEEFESDVSLSEEELDEVKKIYLFLLFFLFI